nr:glycosyltransferase [Cellulomonas sp. APG4]
MSFHGSEVRIPRVAKALDPWSAFHFADLPIDEAAIEDALAVIRTYADATTVSNVANLPYAPGATYLPLSVDLTAIPPHPLAGGDRVRPVVAHAPSARGLKGTEFVLDAFDRLRAEGVAFDIDLIEGVTNSEVLERYARADIVVEKLVNEGFGVAALEALAVGRPVVSRVADVVRDRHPDLPIVDATPETFEKVLRGLIVDRGERQRLAAAGRPYVEANHDISLTGVRLEEVYAGPGVPAPVVFPGWTVPQRDRALGQVRAQLDELRLATSLRESRSEQVMRALEREVGTLSARNRELERQLVEARHGLAYRVRRRLRQIGSARSR